MPFIQNTPESLIARSDSKNPATTCKGITATGRPCRRPLGTSPQASPTAAGSSNRNGVVAVLQAEDDDHDGAAAFFCWQHQDQAESLAGGDQHGRTTNIVPLQERTSIDTLVDRLGVIDLGDEEQGSPSSGKKKRKQNTRPARKETLPRRWQDMDGPLLAVNTGVPSREKKEPRKHEQKASSNLGLFCCIRSTDRNENPPLRVRRDPEKQGHSSSETSKLPSSLHPPSPHTPRRTSQISTPTRDRQSGMSQTSSHLHLPPRPTSHTNQRTSQNMTSPSTPTTQRNSRQSVPDTPTHRPLLRPDPPSQTQNFLSLIPSTLSPQTTALLLAELAKPISPHDEEGYIYIFWLTDSTSTTPDPQAATSLLGDNIASTPNGRRKSDILQSHAARSRASGAGTSTQAPLLLKIGRASNVQRRMNEWTRQCGYSLSLIRFYPHVLSSSSPSPPSRLSSPPASPSPLKVPHAQKVERLIHLELAQQRVKRGCGHCGKEHREWFEVESTREGLRKVDELVKRWTQWDMGGGGA